jgi:glycosyltransferase involved in cell wall biosynthesis
MSVFNGGPYIRYLDEAVGAVLAQTLTDFEMVIVDDGPDTETAVAVAALARRDRRIRVVHRRTGSHAVRLNEALAAARGRLIAIADADDVSLPHRLEREAAFLDAHPEIVGVGGWLLAIDADGLPLVEVRQESAHEAIEAMHMRGLGGVPHPAGMVRADALRSIGGYRDGFHGFEDFDMWIRLAEVGRLANLPEILLRYRRHPGSLCHTRIAELRTAVGRSLREACSRRGVPFTWDPGPWPRAVPEWESLRAVAYHALHAGYAPTARKYAAAALRLRPSCWRSWLLLALASPLGTPFRAAARARIGQRLATAAAQEAA